MKINLSDKESCAIYRRGWRIHCFSCMRSGNSRNIFVHAASPGLSWFLNGRRHKKQSRRSPRVRRPLCVKGKQPLTRPRSSGTLSPWRGLQTANRNRKS